MARKTKADKIAAAKIQAAVYGFSIPMMSIPKLYAAMKAAVEAGATSEALKQIVATFPGVEAA